MSQPLQLYLAAVYTNSYMPGGNGYELFNDHEKGLAAQIQKHNILESWHYVGRQRYVDYMRRNGAKIFLDSGAFSAHTLGVTLKVEDYVNYIKHNQDIIRVEDGNLMASVLDGIGDAQKTFENQMHMERLGVRPLPCFHFGEDERYLEWYVANYDYITIGGMVGKETNDLIVWLDRIWQKHMMDGSGRAKIKVHAFGITSPTIMDRYPWYSCDSSSWIQAASFGAVVLPEYGALHISEKAPNRHTAGQHFSNLVKPMQDEVRCRIEGWGFSPERLSTEYASRACFNLYSYMQINANVNARKVNTQMHMVRELF